LYKDHIGKFDKILEITVVEFIGIFLGFKHNPVITALWFVVDDIAQPYLNRDSTGICFTTVPGTSVFRRQQMPAFFTTWNSRFNRRIHFSVHIGYQTVNNKEGLKGVFMDTSAIPIVNPMSAP